MNRKITYLICLAVVLVSACSKDEPQTPAFAVAEFSGPIRQTVIFQTENRAYVATGRGTTEWEDEATDIYRVDLLTGETTFIFSTDDQLTRFIVSDDEKLIAIGVAPVSQTAESPARLEVFDLSTSTKTVLRTVEGFFTPSGFDPENTTLLYANYGTTNNKIRKIDLTSGTETILSVEGSASILDINRVTRNILLWSSGTYTLIDWNGASIGEPITGFQPQFFSPDGEEIIGYRGIITDIWDYQEVVRYTIATGEVESLTGTETTGAFYATSMSPDQTFVLGMVGKTQYAFDLYVVNTVTQERNRLMSKQGEESGIGFFDAGRQVLFVAPNMDNKLLYGIRL